MSGQKQIRKDHENMAKELEFKKSCKDVIFINDQDAVILSAYLPVLTDECNLSFMRWFYCSKANICDGLLEIVPSNSREEILFSKKGDYYYTLDSIGDNVEVSVELGEYYLNNPLNIAKALSSRWKSNRNNFILISSKVDCFVYNEKTYYRVTMSSNGNNRRINKVTLKKK